VCGEGGEGRGSLFGEQMSAVLQSQDEFYGRGHELMQTWALFRRGGERDGLPRAVNGGWSEPLDKAKDSEPPTVVEIDRILAGLYRAGYEHSVEIAKRFYLAGEPVWSLAHKVCRTEGFVRLTIRGLCDLVESRVTE
jgi:hypothetical protein